MTDKPPHKVIVCVDNDKDACSYLASCLGRDMPDEVRAVAFSSPAQALKYLEKEKADLVTSCIRMPGMDEFEFLGRVKGLYPEMPVVVITESGDIEEYFKAMHIGAYEFINKPVLLHDLYQVVCRATGLRAPADSHGFVQAGLMSRPPRKKVVIFGEDDEHILMAMCIILERMGYDVVPAENGLEVQTVLDIITPDVVVLDLYMPLMDGAEVLKRIKDNPRHAGVPVVMLSACAQSEDIERCRALGCSGFLNKPVGMDELGRALEACLYPNGGRRAMRADLSVKATVTRKGISHRLFTRSLSMTGVFIRTKNPLPPGTEVEVSLPVNGCEMALKGLVVYVNRIDSKTITFHPGMAIEFEDVSPEDSARLKDYVSSLITQDALE